MGGRGSSSGKGGGGGAANAKGTSFEFHNIKTGKSATATIESDDLDYRMTKSRTRIVLSKDEYIKNYGGSIGTMESTGSLKSPYDTMTYSTIRQSSKGNYYRIDETLTENPKGYGGDNSSVVTNRRIRRVKLR